MTASPWIARFGAMIAQDYYVKCYPMLRGGGSRGVYTGFAEGPYLDKLDAYKCAIRDALRRNNPGDVTGLFCETWAYQGYPVNNWVQEKTEVVPL